MNGSLIFRLNEALNNAEAVVIGAGAGLSTAAGYVYGGKRFTEHFADFEAKYGFHDMYSGGFFPYETLEEKWAYWSRYVYLNRYSDIPNGVYAKLLGLVRDKNYFVITTNVDHCFQRSGFDKQRLFYTQGDFGLFQCSVPCHNATYGNEEAIRRMVAEQKDRRIPSELIPRCPECGKPMSMNLRADDTFVQDEGWYKAAERYGEFIDASKLKHVLFLELGVGFNTPIIIKYPFMRMTMQNKNAVYCRINKGEAYVPEEIRDRSIIIDGDIGDALDLLYEVRS